MFLASLQPGLFYFIFVNRYVLFLCAVTHAHQGFRNKRRKGSNFVAMTVFYVQKERSPTKPVGDIAPTILHLALGLCKAVPFHI